MSEIMTEIPFSKIMKWAKEEYNNYGRIFGVSNEKFYKNSSNTSMKIFGEEISSVVGPAAGPNSQLAQNIIASYLAGARLIELKTVQEMDGEDLRKCVPRPCINAEDEGYNVEWSTELTVEAALDEYIKAHIGILVLAKELNLSDKKDFIFNMSVGYNLEGIKSKKIDRFIEGLKDASNLPIWDECKKYLIENISDYKNIDLDFINNITANVCNSITLSTLHGCPANEISSIAKYLLTEKKLHTYIKCNPTLLGYEFARNTLDSMGYDYIVFDDHHFVEDLQFADAVVMLRELKELGASLNLAFGVKITNTFPVKIDNKELPGEEMYMSGRALFPLSINVANKLSKEFNGELPISYSGGADFFNIEDLVKVGIRPITVATTILKPGGYERLNQLATISEKHIDGGVPVINVNNLEKLAEDTVTNKYLVKDCRPVASRKTSSKLPLYNCYKAPCKDGGCPIEQQIPEYLKLVAEHKYDEAFKIIAIDNGAPSITGTICSHNCQNKCTRLDYDTSLKIRQSKKYAVVNAQDNYVNNIKVTPLKTDKKVAIIGGGPTGVATAMFLRRNGVATTVFEKREKPFGIVQYVIPEFRINDDEIKKDYDLAVKTGVEFKFNCEETDVEKLKKDFDFVVIATGAWDKGVNPIEGSGANIVDAIEFLAESRKSNLKMDLGKSVAVIGGGDVAMDCARAALKTSGVETSTIVYRRTKSFMPASHEEIVLAKEDGVKFVELVSPLKYDNSTLTCEVMKLGERDASGRKGVVSTGENIELKFDTVIIATGAKVNTDIFVNNNINLDNRKNPIINEENETSVENVYIAGDCKIGPTTVVEGIGDGKKITISILNKLSIEPDFVKVSIPQDKSLLYYKKGILSEDSSNPEDGMRCLSCDTLCEICCDVCPNRANVTIGENKILHIDGMCNECGNCGIFCPHTGNPYKDKITLFWSEEDFVDSENIGFLQLSDDTFKIRDEKGEILTHKLGENNISKEMGEFIDIVIKKYSFYI